MQQNVRFLRWNVEIYICLQGLFKVLHKEKNDIFWFHLSTNHTYLLMNLEILKAIWGERIKVQGHNNR